MHTCIGTHKGTRMLLSVARAQAHVVRWGASLAMDGRWVVYGLMGGNSVEGPLLGLLQRKRASLLLTTLRNRDDDYKVMRTHKGRKRALV
jgi:hypothetical protein